LSMRTKREDVIWPPRDKLHLDGSLMSEGGKFGGKARTACPMGQKPLPRKGKKKNQKKIKQEKQERG